MRKLLKWTLYLFLAATVLVALLLAFIVIRFPRVAPPAAIAVAGSPELEARGAYLVNLVAGCHNCHGERDWASIGGAVKPGTEGMGALPVIFAGPKTHAANITPAGIGDWTDGEVLRAITAGIGRDGKALHPLMPYDIYGRLTESDAHAIVAHLRTLPPVEHTVARQPMAFPIRLLADVLVKPYDPPPPIPPGDTVARGKYLMDLAQCTVCHREDLSGGLSFQVPGFGKTTSADINPNSEAGASNWSREDFIAIFKSMDNEESRIRTIDPDGQNTVMPWLQFAQMTEEDLGAIFDYMRTVQPRAPAKHKRDEDAS